MRFNWVDLLAIGVVSFAGGIQFLRSTKDFSLVLYETFLLIAALIGTVRVFIPIHQLTGLSYTVCFAGCFVILAVLAILIASGINRFFEFSFGGFGYFFGLFLGIACGFVFGHAVLRVLLIAYGVKRPEFADMVHRSWMASQVLYFGAFRELLAMLRIARYNNI